MTTTNPPTTTATFEVHGAQGPAIPGEPSLAARKAQAQQEAERDAAHHLDDAFSIAARGGLLVGEISIDHETRQLQQRARIAKRDALLINNQHLERARAEGIDGVGVDELRRQLDAATAARDEAVAARAHSVDVLTGKVADPWGRILTGTIPSGASLWRHRLLEWTPIAVLSLLEAVPGYFTARTLLNSSDPLFATVVALMLAAGLFGLPIVIGHALRGPKDPLEEPTRRESAKRALTVLGSGAVWLALVVLLGLSRADEARSIREVGRVTFDVPTLLLMAIFLAVGIAIIVLHTKANPHREAVVGYNQAIRKHDSCIQSLRGRIGRSEARIEMQLLQREATEDMYDHHIDHVLPVQGEEVKEVYRREFLRLSGDAETTGAAMQPYTPLSDEGFKPDDPTLAGMFEGR